MTRPTSLYQQVLGADFAALPAPLQQFHALQGSRALSGWVDVAAPASPVARLLAWCLGAPQRARSGPLRFELRAQAGRETWTRHFPGKTMVSHLGVEGGFIEERLGAARLGFALEGDGRRLKMHLVRLHFLGVPCPRWLLPDVVAEETASAGRLHFHVRASLPLVGVVSSYRGHLELAEGAAS